VVLREDRSWLAIALAPSVVIALSLLWRRTRPLAAVTVAFGTLIAFELARIVAIDVTGLNSIAAALVLSYALLRWGAGREAVLGLGAILVWLAVTHIADRTSFDEVIAGYGFFLFAAALGASLRFHANARLRDIEQAKLRLRNELARELHDTVGHHVSAIAIQAQAGRAMAAYDPDRALAVLETIEEAASRTLQEDAPQGRTVGALGQRRGELRRVWTSDGVRRGSARWAAGPHAGRGSAARVDCRTRSASRSRPSRRTRDQRRRGGTHRRARGRRCDRCGRVPAFGSPATWA
jgi:hypothetical protein